MPLCTSAVVIEVAGRVEKAVGVTNLRHASLEKAVGRTLTNAEVHYLMTQYVFDKNRTCKTPERLSQTTLFERQVLSRVMKKITAPEKEAKVATLLYGIWEVESCLDKVAKDEVAKYEKQQEEAAKLQASLSTKEEVSEINDLFKQAQQLMRDQGSAATPLDKSLFHTITRIQLDAQSSPLAKKK